MALSFVDCCEYHLPSLRDLFARAYGPNHVLVANQHLFDWQFKRRSNGHGTSEGYAIKLAVRDGHVVGCLGYIAAEMAVGGEPRRGAWVINWLVDRSQQLLGLGPLLMREVLGQFAVGLNVGPNEAARTILTRMGWADLGPLTRYVQVIDPGAAAQLTTSGRLDWPDDGTKPHALPAGIDVTRVPRFSRDVSDLWNAVRGTSHVAGACRSASFLNWRYADHPAFTYRLFECRRGGQLQGMAVCRLEAVRDMPITIVRLTELMGTEPAICGLLSGVSQDGRAAGAALVDFFCASGRLLEVMCRNGFVTGPRLAAADLPVVFQPIDRRRTAPVVLAHIGDGRTDPLDWYVTTGDADQDRPN